MKYLKIKNDGCLDIRLISLMGGTTKSNDVHKIGQFGTGLKYSIAYLIRNNISFHIFRDGMEVKISTREEEIGGEVFKILYFNDERSSITHKMGYDWKPWMIVRELYSNALDEGGCEYGIVDSIDVSKNTTEFYIELTPKFLEIYNNWRDYFTVDSVPMYENEDYKIHPTSGPLRIYKQGILIKELKQDSLFNYDIKDAPLNELREFSGSINLEISNAIKSIDDPTTIEYFLEHITEDHYEGKELDYVWANSFNKTWEETIGEAKIIHKEAKDKLLGAQPNADLTKVIVVPKVLYRELVKTFDHISLCRVINKSSEFFEIYDKELEDKLKQCLTILEESGYFIHPELNFVFGDFADKKTLAQVNLDKKEIFLSQKLKTGSLFDFCSTLVEENEHFNTGLLDCSREFQQHFINLYTHTLLEKSNIKL